MRSSAACSALAKRAYALSVRRAAATDASTAPLARPITRASPSHERQRARRSDRARIHDARMTPHGPGTAVPRPGWLPVSKRGCLHAAPAADLLFSVPTTKRAWREDSIRLVAALRVGAGRHATYSGVCECSDQ